MITEQTEILSIHDAIMIATEWADLQKKDDSRARAFAREWFDETPPEMRTKFHLHLMLKAFERYRADDESQLTDFSIMLRQSAMEWELELVKHLATFNGAGIAGTAALIAATKYSNSLYIKTSLIFFSIGLMLSVLNMWLNSQSLVTAYEVTEAQRQLVNKAQTWEALRGSTTQRKGLTADNWNRLAIRVGWSSALIGIVATTLVARALFLN